MNLQQRISELPWHHQIDLGGVLTPGGVPKEIIKAQAEIYFRDGVGDSVLDIGCWDGYNSFEAKRRDAKRVLATDHYVWKDGVGSRQSFELARQTLDLDVEVMDIDIPDISEK